MYVFDERNIETKLIIGNILSNRKDVNSIGQFASSAIRVVSCVDWHVSTCR